MGINFEGIKPELKAKFDQIFSDGEVSQSEINALTAEEQDALMQGLGGKISQENYDSISKMVEKSKKTGNVAKGKDEAPNFFKHPIDWFTSDKVSTGAKVAAGVGATIAAVGAVAASIAYPPVALGVLGVGVLASCSSGDDFDDASVRIEDNSSYQSNVGVTVSVENKIKEIDNGKNDEIIALLNTIVGLLKDGQKISQENNAMLTKILDALTTQNLDNAEIKALLQNILDTLNDAVAGLVEISEENRAIMNAILDAINKLDSDMAKNLHVIMGKLDNMGKNNKDLLLKILNEVKSGNAENSELLNKILQQVTDYAAQDRDMDSKTHELLTNIINNIGDMNANMSAALAEIVTKIDTLSAENRALLEAILNKMGDMDANNQKNFAVLISAVAQGNKISADGVKVLTNILNKLDKMDKSTQANFKAVIDMLVKGNNIDAEILNKLNQAIGKLDKMDANQANFFTQILAKFDGLEAGQKESLKRILDAINNNTSAINKNTEVAQATYELVAKLLDNVDKLGGKADEILNAIANISTGANVDLSTIEKLLADLLKSSEANNGVLTSIDSKLDAVSVTLGGIKVMLGEGHEKILAKLDEILKKIPNGCKCDITVIVEKLDELIESIKKNPDDDKKHEGILDDLEDLFN